MYSSSVPGSLGRNDPCHCGSCKKYKSCLSCLGLGTRVAEFVFINYLIRCCLLLGSLKEEFYQGSSV